MHSNVINFHHTILTFVVIINLTIQFTSCEWMDLDDDEEVIGWDQIDEIRSPEEHERKGSRYKNIRRKDGYKMMPVQMSHPHPEPESYLDDDHDDEDDECKFKKKKEKLIAFEKVIKVPRVTVIEDPPKKKKKKKYYKKMKKMKKMKYGGW